MRNYLLVLVVCAGTLLQASAKDFGLVEWLISKGGTFNDKQELRQDASSSRIGLFAKETIKEGEVLAKIPFDLIISPESQIKEGDEDEKDDGDDFCGLVAQVATEMKNGDKSEFGPYMQYLSSLMEAGPAIPSTWSDAGKDLLINILEGDQLRVPPIAATDLLDVNWYDDCDDTEDLEVLASLVMQQTSFDHIIPIYDLYTPRSTDYNVEVDYVEEMFVQVIATRTIQVGEELQKYSIMCDDCDEDANEYGTPEIFRDYGFVESYPRRFIFQPVYDQVVKEGYANNNIDFELLVDDDGVLSVSWPNDMSLSSYSIFRLLQKELRRLCRFQNVMYDIDSGKPSEGIPQNEWDSIWEYYSAVRAAMVSALESIIINAEDLGFDDEFETCSECSAEGPGIFEVHYDDLEDETDFLRLFLTYDCERTEIEEMPHYKELEAGQTNYQRMSFSKREEDQDICMDLDTWLQICNSHRPHYHEFFVHFPARYIDTIKRVIFIGGGDSMLLHEVLKYPSLEKVVGLEIDQQVPRKSFKYFNVQPHFDNDKVEWWYGDATKSLPLLPKDYWGSFDLVLVDLSETVMSISVTDELDIFGAISLLLKPEGVMIKNEAYLYQINKVFDHTIHVYYGEPKMCTQILTMASNGVDFLHHPVSEHNGVERLLLEPLEDDDVRFKYIHDYVKTDARAQGKCSSNNTNDVRYGAKAGILEIIDAEDTNIGLDDGLEKIVETVIKEQGLSLVGPPIADDNTFVFMLGEGYIVLRVWPDERYCGIDLNLWGSFDKQESVHAALTKAIGSRSESSFRIVVGGMHGSKTWEKDKETVGIRLSQTRNCEESPESDGTTVDMDVSVAMETSVMKMVDEFVVEDAVVVVACGREEDGECLSLKVLKEHPKVSKAVPVYACGDLTSDLMYVSEPDIMYRCEKSIHGQMKGLFGGDDDRTVDAFILDSSAPFSLAQIFRSLWGIPMNREEWLSSQYVFLAPYVDESESEWRDNFLERHRRENHPYAVFRSITEVRSVGSRVLSVGVFSANDRYFMNHLYAFEKSLSGSLSGYGNIQVETPTIQGGLKYFETDYDSVIFAPDAYDPAPALDQMSNQVPLGRQSVFQFEDVKGVLNGFDSIVSFLESTYSKLGMNPTKQSQSVDVGDGGMIVSTFAEGGVLVLVWDGRTHVDVNLFSRDERKDRADRFLSVFVLESGLQGTLRDDQPRGTGRVVLFQSEI